MKTTEYILKEKQISDDDFMNTGVLRLIKSLMIEYARLHVKEALKQASENFKMKQRDDIHELDMNDDWMEVDKESILNAYPIDEIK